MHLDVPHVVKFALIYRDGEPTAVDVKAAGRFKVLRDFAHNDIVYADASLMSSYTVSAKPAIIAPGSKAYAPSGTPINSSRAPLLAVTQNAARWLIGSKIATLNRSLRRYILAGFGQHRA